MSLIDQLFLVSTPLIYIVIQGEHGVGLVKRDYLPHELGESTVDAMRKVSPDRIPDLIPKTPFWLTIYLDQASIRSSMSTKL
jgi:hypothetical protein